MEQISPLPATSPLPSHPKKQAQGSQRKAGGRGGVDPEREEEQAEERGRRLRRLPHPRPRVCLLPLHLLSPCSLKQQEQVTNKARGQDP
jgi:hypothetical protein